MSDAGVTIPDVSALVSAVLRGATNLGSVLHGESHWKCVSWTGLMIARSLQQVDSEVVCLFGLIHDSRRLDDGTDIDHGRRAAVFAKQLRGNVFDLNDERFEMLSRACAGHADGYTSDDSTIGACWDADRLNLCRLGVRPNPKLLSTALARQTETMRAAERLEGAQHDWARIFAELGRSNTVR